MNEILTNSGGNMKKLVMLFLALSCVCMLFACSGEEQAEVTDQSQPEKKADVELAADVVIDPVCGMKIKQADAVATADHKGQTYYFCMEGDKDAFVEEPAKYLAKVDKPKTN
jgi:Cu+-exporting ATPase